MPAFVACFPKGNAEGSPYVIRHAAEDLQTVLGYRSVQIESAGASVALACERVWSRAARYVPAQDGSGWLVCVGILLDVRCNDGVANLEELLERFLAREIIEWNDFEGTFALAVFDRRHRRAVAVNDQMSVLNLYYTEDSTASYVTTAALPLARALGRGLDPAGVREFLARGALMCPASVYDGVRRLGIGEHLQVDGDRARVARHWHYPLEGKRWSLSRAAEEAATVAVDRLGRYSRVGGPVLADLTGGYDSRLVAAAAHCAGAAPVVTVNGVTGEPNVRIAQLVATRAGWPLRFFEWASTWRVTIGSEERRRLTYYTDGNLPFTELYHHWLTRPLLAQKFGMHAIGIGGEFLRYHPWGQEFGGIGRRRRANIERILRYRMLSDGAPAGGLFRDDWYHAFVRQLRGRIKAVCDECPGTRTTTQLDAVHVWKQTGHASLYVSGASHWLPDAAPLLTGGFVTIGMTVPWHFRLTSRLTRLVTHLMCAEAASVITQYGGTAGPVRMANVHLHAIQPLRRLAHLLRKVGRVAVNGQLAGLAIPTAPRSTMPRKPYVLEELRCLLDPARMRSRELYAPEGITRLLAHSDQSEVEHESMLLRIATLEQVCQELDVTPPPGFLLTGCDRRP